MPDQHQQTPATPVPIRSSAHQPAAGGIAIPAPVQLQPASQTPQQPSGATPPPPPLANIIQRQPTNIPAAPTPFRLPITNTPSPQHTPITPWHTVVQRQSKTTQPVIQRVRIKVRASETMGNDQDVNGDTTELYALYQQSGKDLPYFNRDNYPEMEAALFFARSEAMGPEQLMERLQIEEMLVEVYGHNWSTFMTDEEKKELGSQGETKEGNNSEEQDDHVRKKKKLTDTKFTSESSPIIPGNIDLQQALGSQAMETEKELKTPQKSQIGIVTWNVAHFSDKETVKETAPKPKGKAKGNTDETDQDEPVEAITRRGFQERLQQILQKFRKVMEDWDVFRKEAEAFIAAIEKYKGNDKLWKGVHNRKDTRERLERGALAAKEQLAGSGGLFAGLGEYINFKWNEAYEEALKDNLKKAPLAQKVKDFRAFGREYLDNLINVLKSVTKIWGPDIKAATFLRNMSSYVQEGPSKDDTDPRTEEERLISLESLQEKKGLLRKLLNRAEIEELARALHTRNIALQAEQMFANNSWLDIMVLQEVNNPSLLEQSGSSYDMDTGPQMVSGGENPQKEYYPILIRKGSGFTVSAIFYVNTKGNKISVKEAEEQDKQEDEEKEKQEKKPAPYEDVDWDKSAGSYRPIMVYELERPVKDSDKKEKVWIGVVHTTPETDSGVAEFNRINIYNEIKKGLATLSAQAKDKGIPLIIGGDYYLTAEAVVAEKSRKRKRDDKKEAENKETVNEVKEGTDRQFDQLTRKKEWMVTFWEDLQEVETQLGIIATAKQEIAARDLKSQKFMELRNGWISDAEAAINIILKKYEVGSVEELDALFTKETLLQAERDKKLIMLTEYRKEKQILRNVNKTTTKHRVEALDLHLTQSISGTNPKEDPLTEWSKLQIADFFIDQGWQTTKAGIMRPGGKMVTTDAEDLRHSKYWQHFSDHFPVGGIFSTAPKDEEAVMALLSQAFVEDEKAEDTAKQANINMFAFQYIRDLLRTIQQQNQPDKTEEEHSDEMTAKVYLHKIRLLEAQYDKLPKLSDKKRSKNRLMAYFKKLPGLIAAIDPTAKIDPPGYDDYVTVYLQELGEKGTDIGGLEGFKKQRLTLALVFLKERLAALRKKSPETSGPDTMQEDESQDPTVQWISIQGFIAQIQTLEQALIKQKKMEEAEQLVVFRPEDVEPESTDPALVPKEKEPIPGKQPSLPPQPELAEQEQYLLDQLIQLADQGDKIWDILFKEQEQVYPLFRARESQILSAMKGPLARVAMNGPDQALHILELLIHKYGVAPAKLLQPLAAEALQDLKIAFFTAAALARIGVPEQVMPFLQIVLGRLQVKQLPDFMEMLTYTWKETNQAPNTYMILRLLHMPEKDSHEQQVVIKVLLSMGWVMEDALGELLASPPVPVSNNEDSHFPGFGGWDALRRAREESLLTFGQQQSFSLSGEKVGLDEYMELYNADGELHNCLIFSIVRVLKLPTSVERIVEIGKTIRENKKVAADELLDTGDIPQILALLGAEATLIVISTLQNAKDPDNENRTCFDIELIGKGNIAYLINAGNLHFGYGAVKPGYAMRMANQVVIWFKQIDNSGGPKEITPEMLEMQRLHALTQQDNKKDPAEDVEEDFDMEAYQQQYDNWETEAPDENYDMAEEPGEGNSSDS
ncbi:hypothetical protein F0L74_21435 [Chitinophaga agrisoli]|uniref:Uncharacterized protein n=1 Tax=Chitinophaga agrisoli TaxID=2607653 RepID=A0A5B2VI71_9BACT|nr:hypothetical protein [Chitinophaga agrisoli]KAA2238781.1 hypothetical protein F0L74_21435 [Chitinophaga agrisoli]